MDITEQVKRLISGEKYDFLRQNKYLDGQIIFLALGGSHAYGTSTENSDIDLRGVCLSRIENLLGLSDFEQITETTTDTTVYAFNKFVRLILNCNPNTIEMLGAKQEHYFLTTKIGSELIANRKMFLSKRAIKSFSGYAMAQLNRLQNNLARHTYSQAERERHMLNSINRAMMDFDGRYADFEEGSIKLYIDKSEKADFETEIFADISLKHYPLRDYKSIWSEMNSIIKNYGKINHRNNKKDDAHLAKHAMHLIRLYLMCIDILEKEEIITYRENDINLLMSIRNGAYRKSDGTYDAEFFEILEGLERRLDYAKINTSLPAEPDIKKIEEFVIEVNSKGLK
ncbi:MAG: nucleotidyltransferase domain-containing protein [Turicibacter sp.]|nr:nucleotidyltransferase domain-containing protein [Turicibacter sp.]